jgi:hypothetical protein
MIEILPTPSPRILALKLSGKLHDADYQACTPLFQKAAAAGPFRLLAVLEDFHGWDLHAAWDDFKLGMEVEGSLERMALVGDGALATWMTRLSKPFTKAQVRQFHAGEQAAALAWLQEP